MIFKELEVWNWRHLDNRLLKDLTPGLNLIVGPNESGKSSLFEALRFALFESSKGVGFKEQVRSHYLTGAPKVRLVFDMDGKTYEVTKQFLDKPHTVLTGHGGLSLRSEDADNFLFQLLRMEKSRTRKENFEDAKSLWKLLWIRQGDSVLSPDGHIGDSGRARLQDALASEVEGLATGETGRALMDRVKVEFDRYFTSTERPKSGGPLKNAMDDEAQALKSTREYRAQRDRAHGLSREIQRSVREADQLRETESVRRAEAESAQSRAKSVLELDGKIKEQAYQLKEAVNAWEQAEAALKGRGELEGEAQAVEKDLQGKTEKLKALGEECRAAEDLAKAAEEALSGLGRGRKEAEEQAALARAQEKRLNDLKRLGELERDIKRGDDNLKEQLKLRGELGSIKVTASILKQLQTKRDACQRAEAKLEGASARVEIQAHQALSFGDISLKSGESRSLRVSEPQTLEVPGVLTLNIRPGVADLPELKRALDNAKDALEKGLRAIDLASISEAESALARRGETEGSLKNLEQQLSFIAPEGLDSLKSAHRSLKGGIDSIPIPEGEIPSLEEAEAALKVARDALETAQAESIALDKRLGQRRQDVAVAKAQVDNAKERFEALRARLDALPKAGELEAALKSKAEARGKEERSLAELQTRRESLGGEVAIAEAEQAQRALQRHQERLDKIKSKLMEQRAELRASGADGLHTKVQEAEAHLEACQARLKREQAHSDALLALKSHLEAAQGEAQAQLSEPVIRAVQPYLRQVFPTSGLKLGEGWSLEGLAGEQAVETFDNLSRGAREQLSILVRLGLAEILAGEGRLPLILDDALVNSDPERLRRMTQALYRATRKGHLQVLFFSCHTEAFGSLGEDHRIDLVGHPRR